MKGSVTYPSTTFPANNIIGPDVWVGSVEVVMSESCCGDVVRGSGQRGLLSTHELWGPAAGRQK